MSKIKESLEVDTNFEYFDEVDNALRAVWDDKINKLVIENSPSKLLSESFPDFKNLVNAFCKIRSKYVS